MIDESAAAVNPRALVHPEFLWRTSTGKNCHALQDPFTSENVISDPGDSTAHEDKQVSLQKFHLDGEV